MEDQDNENTSVISACGCCSLRLEAKLKGLLSPVLTLHSFMALSVMNMSTTMPLPLPVVVIDWGIIGRPFKPESIYTCA